MEDCNIGLEELKKEYEKLRKKYNLPEFEEMNKDFEIEKLQERETETLTREIRRAMMDKNVSYLKFTEMFMNPSQAPMIFLVLVKSLDEKSKKILEELYLTLGKYEIRNIGLDNEFDEEKDAKFIKEFYKEWQKIKKKFSLIIETIEKNWEKKGEKNIKNYLG